MSGSFLLLSTRYDTTGERIVPSPDRATRYDTTGERIVPSPDRATPYDTTGERIVPSPDRATRYDTTGERIGLLLATRIDTTVLVSDPFLLML